MFRQSFYAVFIAAALIFLGNAAAFAQSAPFRGKIVLKQADGTVAPLADARVDVYRTDIKSGKWNTKTKKNGEFSFAGLPLGAVVTVSVSGAGASPLVQPNIKINGATEPTLTLGVGDGRVLTEDEVRNNSYNPSAGANTAAGTGGSAAAPGSAPKETADDKKKREEYERQVKEINEKNAKTESNNKAIQQALTEGNKAFTAKNYALAVQTYDSGINLDATHPGAPVLMTNKAIALKNIAIDDYNSSTKMKGDERKAMLDKVKTNLTTAFDSTSKALELLKATSAPTDPASLTNFNSYKFNATREKAEIIRLMVVTRADVGRAVEGVPAFQEYIALETDQAAKDKAQANLARMLMDSGDFDKAVVEYDRVLEKNPNDIDALAGKGLSMVAIAYNTNNKAQFQEALNVLQKYADAAPDGHAFKADVLATIESVKNEQKIQPQKVKSAPARKGKN